MQKNFVEAFLNPPHKNPLSRLKNQQKVKIPQSIRDKWADAYQELRNPERLLKLIPVNHSVLPLNISETREAGLKQLKSFLKNDLMDYGKLRNQPDLEKGSGLSPYLHFGKYIRIRGCAICVKSSSGLVAGTNSRSQRLARRLF